MRQVRFTTAGWMESPGYMLGLPARKKVPVPTVVAVCERDDGTILLIDAGWSAETCSSPKSIGFLQYRTLGLRARPGDDVASQLRRAGLEPSKVTTIVATHLHLDHVGGVTDFPNAELVATHDELTQAYRSSWLRGYNKNDIDRVRRLRLVRLRPEPQLGFSHTFELEPGVTLLDAHGHTAGHTAVIVEQGHTRWIHGGDVAYRRSELRGIFLSPLSRLMAHDPKAARIAQRRLRNCFQDHGDVRVVLSHDGEVYKHLPRLLLS